MEVEILLADDLNKIITSNAYDSTLLNLDNYLGRQRTQDLVKLKNMHVLGPTNSIPNVYRT